MLKYLAPLALLACTGDGEVTLDDSGDSATDSPPGETGETGETGESGETAETADTDVEYSSIAFEVQGDFGGTAIQIVHAALGEDSISFDDTIATAAVTEEVQEVDVPEAPGDHLVQLDPEKYPDLFGAYYFSALWTDDGDAVHEDDEVYVGFSPMTLVFLSGDIPADLAAWGLVEGWNAVELSDPPVLGSVDAIPMPQSLVPNEALTVGGSYLGTDPVEDMGLVVLPSVAFDGSSVERLLVDTHMSDPWTISFEGAPPEDHLVESNGLLFAMEVVLGHQDLDGSGTFTAGDVAVYTSCKDGAAAIPFWIDPPTLFDAAWYFTWTGWNIGWSLTQDTDEGPVPLDEAAYETLVIDGSCSL